MIAVVEGLPGDPVSPLLIRDCAGAVQVTRCYWHEGNSKAFAGLGCVQIQNSEDVVLDRCIANGQGASALAGMAIYDSRVALYDCWVKGSDEAEWRPDEGMPGLYASASYVWIERGYFKGGWGPWTCPYGVYGRGGPGALIENLSTVFVTDTGFEGGHGGIGGNSYFSCAEYGPPGYENVAINSKLEFLPDEIRGLHLEPVLTWGREVEIRAFGSPGETLYLRRSTDTIFETPSDGRGIVHVPGSPATEIELGIVPEDGELTTSFSLRGLLPDGSVSTFRIHSEFNTLYLQVVGRDEANRARYGAVVPLTYYPMGLLDTQPRVLRVDVDADIGFSCYS